jgi:type II secretory pathway pseudopilin PulG
VGVALPKPSHELPSYGRSLVLTVFGSLTVLAFVVQTIIAIFSRSAKSFGFWSLVAAAQTASWRLKWIAIPIAILTVWTGRKLYKSIKNQPERFCGLKYARRGLMASTVVVLLIGVLIGVTVPARLRQRNDSLEAAHRVHVLTISRAFFEYQLQFKSLPDKGNVKEALAKLPDPDGTLAAALREMDPAGYQPRAEVAAVSTERPTSLRGAAIRRASLTSETDDATPAGVSFTHYDLALPGEDKILGTEDDWVSLDGVVMRLADVSKGGIGKTAGTLRP